MKTLTLSTLLLVIVITTSSFILSRQLATKKAIARVSNVTIKDQVIKVRQ